MTATVRIPESHTVAKTLFESWKNGMRRAGYHSADFVHRYGESYSVPGGWTCAPNTPTNMRCAWYHELMMPWDKLPVFQQRLYIRMAKAALTQARRSNPV